MAILRTFAAGLLCAFCFSSFMPAQAGPNYAVGSAEIQSAEAVMKQGRLTDALQMMQAVIDKYPDEPEVIGWARFLRGEMYGAGHSWNKAVAEIRWTWERCEDGTITNPELRFSAGYALVHYLDKMGIGDLVTQGATQLISQYNENPNPKCREKFGWLHYWRAQTEFGKGIHQSALNDSNMAFSIGQELNVRTMIARSRLLASRCLLELGNTLAARNAAQECLDFYLQDMGSDYKAEAQIRLAQCNLSLGLIKNALATAVEIYDATDVDNGLKAEALVSVADAAIARSATDEAIQALVLIREGLPVIPTWTDITNARWNELTGRIGAENLNDALVSARSDAQGSAHVALEIILADKTQPDRVMAIALADRLKNQTANELLLSKIEKLYPNSEGTAAEPQSDEVIIAQLKTDRLKLDQFLETVRNRGWHPDHSYDSWLDEHQEALPRIVYLLEKGEWFLHKSVLPRQPGDPEYQETAPGWLFYYEPHRNADAIPIFEEAVKAAVSDEDIMRAYVGLVSAQARTQVDYHPVFYQFKSAIGDSGLWEKGLLVMCDNLTGDNVVSDSLPNQNPTAAEEIYTILISNGRNPVWLREAHWLKARMQRFWNKRDEAIETLKAMVKLGNAKEDTGGRLMGTGLVLLGQLLMEKGAIAEAEEALSSVIYDPTTYSKAPRQEAYGRYVQLLVDTRRYADAVEVSERAVKEDKKDPYWSGFIQVWTARAENGRGQSSKAREILSRIDKATEDQGLINEASNLLKEIR